MAQLFVSHSSVDNDLALQLREYLGALGYESVFLDLDAQDGLVPGRAWRELLLANLDACDALLVITTPASNASKWCHAELALARWFRKPILSLIIDGSPPHELTADLQGVHLSSHQIDLDRVRTALAVLGLDHMPHWDAVRSPFPGLRAFDESYAAVFFGREQAIDDLRRLLDPPTRPLHGAIVAVLGPSGSGKSSLVRAGLVPVLRTSPDWLVCEPWTPSDAPLGEMALALSHTAKDHFTDIDIERCKQLLGEPGGMAEYVRTLRAESRANADARVLVVIDQADELVTVTSEAARKEFLGALATSCKAPSPLRVVMTARTDLWDKISGQLSRYVTTARSSVLHLPPLTRTELVRIIREPARRSHLVLEEGLLQRMLENTGSGDALPLLAYTLARMTAATGDDGRLTLAGYEAIGGVRGAIASQAREVAANRTEAEVAHAIVHLVGVGETEPYRRMARASDIPIRHREILDELVGARLVIASEGGDDPIYAAAHEALFHAWRPVVDVIDARKDALRLRGRLERRAADWRDSGSTKAGLLSGFEMDQTREWRDLNHDLLSVEVAAYIDASARHARRIKIVRVAVTAVVACLALSLVLVLVLNARSDRHRAAELFASIGERESVRDPVAAGIALLEGLMLEPDNDSLEHVARALLNSPHRDVLHDATPSQQLYELMAGGEVVAAYTSDGVSLWDTTQSRVHELPDSEAPVAMRRDGRLLVVAEAETLVAYDVSSGEPDRITTFLELADEFVETGGFSPDGATLGVVSHNFVKQGDPPVPDEISLWDMRDPKGPKPISRVSIAGDLVTAIAPLDDGRVLISSENVALRVWDALGDGSMQDLLKRRHLSSPGLDVDAHGQFVLLVGINGALMIDVRSGKTVREFDPPGSVASDTAWTQAGAMSPDGRQVVTFDGTGRGYVFTAENGNLVVELEGGGGDIAASVFTASGLVVSSGQDSTMRLWDPEPAMPDGSLTDALCEAFGSHMDQDSWDLVMGETEFESPCPPP